MASANMKDIKRRIKSVESTMQITKAMGLVASSKLRRAREKSDKVKLYFDVLYETIHEIISENRTYESMFNGTSNNVLMIVIAGDRGLAGGYNTNVLKLAQNRYNELSLSKNVIILPIGKKAVEYFEKRNFKIMAKYTNIAESIDIYDAANISDRIVEAFIAGKIDRIELVYTSYVSSLTQEEKCVSVLPIENEGMERKNNLTTYEPSAEEVFRMLIPQYVSGILYGAIVDSYAAELAARRIAMDNASDNAAAMIDELSLIYNRARQNTITQEITEIVGGASTQT
ncbi:MAG: ATP synthase F1 subunit gamma [Clostridiales bacterium]|jgi:F-type H+-transporting ATPase subunit gamma|nr:ATP synthase F1 subunit gamma [Clostridiales bacterium]